MNHLNFSGHGQDPVSKTPEYTPELPAHVPAHDQSEGGEFLNDALRMDEEPWLTKDDIEDIE